MAGVLGTDRPAASITLQPSAEAFKALARLLSRYFCKEGQPNPRVYVGLPSLYGDFLCHGLNLLAYTRVVKLAECYPDETIEIRTIATRPVAEQLTCQGSIKGCVATTQLFRRCCERTAAGAESAFLLGDDHARPTAE